MTAELTLADGNPVTVNITEIAYFQPADDGTLIVFKTGNRSLQVDEDYDTVAAALGPMPSQPTN